MEIKTMEQAILSRVQEQGWQIEPNKDIRSLIEEVGELCREIRRLEDGRQRPDETTPSPSVIKEAITEEIGDILFPLVKVAHVFDTSLEEAYYRHQDKMNKRYKLPEKDVSSPLAPKWDAWLKRAEEIATMAHRGQVDKGGKPYIEHPRRVASLMDTTPEKIVAWLHDVVEDTAWTMNKLKQEGFPLLILEAVEAITKENGETREEYLYRVSRNPLAKRVKRDGDLVDNSDLSRLPHVTDEVKKRHEWYQFARAVLQDAGTTYVYGTTVGGAKRWICLENL